MDKTVSIIPKPLFIETSNQIIKFSSKSVSINIKGESPGDLHNKAQNAFALAGIDISQSGIPLSIQITDQTEFHNEEAYSLCINHEGIQINANTGKGAFYGCISAAQLLNGYKDVLPELTIQDQPVHSWRGFLLDTSRSFYSTDFIKKILDACALHKFNKFHWHLTDDQGWRFEVPGFPELTAKGSVRAAPTMPPSEDGVFDEGKKIRRWYTDEEITEIVNYAQERCIEIIPELEFPGHSSALLAAYPEYGCTGGPYKVENRWGIFPDVACLGNDKVFTLYEAALKKLSLLFPGNYIHIGGDECPHEKWDVCPKCQDRIKKEGLDSAAQLQAWGTNKITAMVTSLGKTPIGWDEVLDNNKHNPLPENVIIQSWRGTEGGIKAASMNHKVIMSPCEFFYFNFKNIDSFEEPGRLGVTTTKKAYSFSPSGKELILGGECALWSEMLPHSRTAEYLLFPRFCAAAEALWLPEEMKDFEDFKQRLETHKELLHKLDYLYFDGKLE